MAQLPNLDHLTLDDFRQVYEPSDDTFLLIDTIEDDAGLLKDLKPRIVYEIGPGSGCATAVLARTLQKSLPGHKTVFIASDINEHSAFAAAATGAANGVTYLEVLMMDLVSAMTDRLKGQVDVLIFNPPYVPTPSEEVGSRDIAAAWAGGVDGREVIDRILPQVPALLSPGGVFYLVVVADNRPKEILSYLQDHGLEATVARSRKARNEQLSVLRFRRPESA